ncbi:MAG: PTS sugar transporter subunit IIA [Candidatus Ratteibacteria bacterium]|nr:PTS sugar transporter subunit IIA [Candidatus Ratteibacteria bacterium]
MKITDFLKEECILIGLKSRDKRGAISELLELLKEKEYIKDSKEILESVMEREKLGSTGIGQGIAVPHTKTDQIEDLVGAVGISENGVAFDALDGEPVYIIFLILAPTKSIGLHLKALAKIARLLKDKTFRNTLRKTRSSSEAFNIIKEDEEKLTSIS